MLNGKYNIYVLDKNFILIFNLDIGFKVIIYFLFVDIFFIEYKFDWVMWY